MEEPGAARLAGDASGPSRERRPLRATGRGPHQQRRRPSGDRSTSRQRSRRQRKDGPRPARAGQRCRVVIRRPRRHLSPASRNQAHRPTERPERLRGRHDTPHPVRARQSSPVSVRPQPRSIRSADADPRQPIVTARPRPADGARRREAWLRAVERGRAASPARGVCSPPSCEPFGILFAILKSVVYRAAVSVGTDPGSLKTLSLECLLRAPQVGGIVAKSPSGGDGAIVPQGLV